MSTFKALLATKTDGNFDCRLTDLPLDPLRLGDAPNQVLIRVTYSSLNYKDGLAVLGKPGVIRKFPMVPGIDLAGVVEESSAPEFTAGMEVLCTGCNLSETVWGGYAEYVRVDADSLVPLPRGLTLHQAMALGTAGFTAMQCILALESHGLNPDGREVLVTGAAGGVGSCAVAMLAQLGYNVVAATGRAELSDYLHSLGAASVVDRATVTGSGEGLARERWAGAVDTVGGTALAGTLAAMACEGSVAACGLAESPKFVATVFPFILRGVNLLGINSVIVPNARRRLIWDRCARDMSAERLERLTATEPLSNIFDAGRRILVGQIRGRVVIDVNR